MGKAIDLALTPRREISPALGLGTGTFFAGGIFLGWCMITYGGLVARAYVWPDMKRKNLTIWTKARTMRILFEGKRATGVDVEQGSERLTVSADRELILSAGAYQSPQLLMLSGIGDLAEEL